MSQTQYELSRAKLDAELEAARKAGDVSRMQMSIAGLMALFKSMYARPPNVRTLAPGMVVVYRLSRRA